jgi:DNA-directed RNA polymerase subunit F
MIKERTPLAMYEVKELLSELKENDKSKATLEFIKTFEKSNSERAKKLRDSIDALGIIKLRTSDIIKIVDVMPENATELNKIFTEISLDADETAKILDAIKNSK